MITSSLLNLFEQKPDELKFIVGRELGHIKCGHTDLRRKSYALLSAVQAINEAIVPDRYQQVVPILAMGRLFTWTREAEFTADRAGLLCCGEAKVAYSAIMRLQHGLREDSKWIDPSAPDFDAQVVISRFRDWQYQPFVSFVLFIKGQTLEHPYYQDRLAMLKLWADSEHCRELIKRREGSDDQLIEVVRIDAFELAPEGQTVDPYVIVTDGDQQVLRTRSISAVREAGWHGFRSTDKGVDQPRACRDGQPLYFEIWDDNYWDDTFVGGFTVYPDGKDAKANAKGELLAEYTTRILWDWREPQTISRPGLARVQVRFSQRKAAADPNVREAKR